MGTCLLDTELAGLIRVRPGCLGIVIGIDPADTEQVADRGPPRPRNHFAQGAVHHLTFGARAGQKNGA